MPIQIGPPGHSPHEIARAMSEYLRSAHQARLQHSDRIRTAISKQPVRPGTAAKTAPGKSGKKSGGKKHTLGPHPLTGKVQNPSGADSQGNFLGGGRVGELDHGSDPAGLRRGGFRVSAPSN
jgi:hypothetical protein